MRCSLHNSTLVIVPTAFQHLLVGLPSPEAEAAKKFTILIEVIVRQ